MTDKRQVSPLRPRWLGVVDACVYTSKTPEKLRHAERKGLLKPREARDGTKSYLVDDLDAFMGIDNPPDQNKVG